MTLVIKNGSVPAKAKVGDKLVDVKAEISLLPGAQKAIDDAVEAIANDPHASRSISIPVNVHLHNEYPKMVGDKVVQNADEEKHAKHAAKK